MDFFDYNNFYSNKYASQSEDNNCNRNGAKNTYNTSSQNVDDMKSTFGEYAKKSENELYDELSQVVQRMKNDGTFDIDAIVNFYNTASPFLNDMQRNRMRNIIEMLKSR